MSPPLASGWSIARPEDEADLERYLLPVEWSSVTFTSHLASARYDSLHIERRDGRIAQAVMLAPHALLLPILDAASPSLPPDVLTGLPASLTVMGAEQSVLAAEGLVGRRVSRSMDYHLMKTEGPLPPPRPSEAAPSRGVHVRRATLHDALRLYPLQRDYEKEEVLLDPAMHVPRVCRAHLKLALRDQIVYLAEDSSGAIGKAGTNARGFCYDQIGGVFTVPAMRNRGIGRAVMRALLEHLLSQKGGACLFVKRDNQPAITLYNRLGFAIAGGYRIDYYIG